MGRRKDKSLFEMIKNTFTSVQPRRVFQPIKITPRLLKALLQGVSSLTLAPTSTPRTKSQFIS